MTLGRGLYLLRLMGWIGSTPYHFLQLMLSLFGSGRRRRYRRRRF
jgi:hypothetical protein